LSGYNLKALRTARGLTQEQVAGALGVSQQAVAKWERGQAEPSLAKWKVLADLLGIEADWGVTAPQRSNRVRIVGSVRAGFDGLAIEEDLGDEAADVKEPDSYRYLVVRGDSMEPQIHEGDLALVRLQPTLEHGQLGVIFYHEEEATLKRFLRHRGGVILQPFNPDYAPMELYGDDLADMRIYGRVIETKRHW